MSVDLSFTDQVAIVTGSTQGLGETTVKLLAERGLAGAIITGRNEQRGHKVAEDLNAVGCETHFVQAELSNVDQCREIVRTADEKFGSINVLVNAGALTSRGSLWDTTPELFDSMMQINVRAPFFLMQETVRVMERQKVEGSIVNISSVASHGSVPMLCPYATSKGALNILTRNVAYSVARHRIRVNALNLGWMDSPGEDVIQRKYHSNGGDWLEQAEAAQPFGRLLKTDEVAKAIAWLAGAESGMITGALIDFDQTVPGAGQPPIAPPVDEWDSVSGISFSFQES